MADGLHQVGFAEAHAATEEQGIEFPSRGFSHGQGGRMGHAAVGAHHKPVEDVARIEPGFELAGRFAGGLGRWQASGLGPSHPVIGIGGRAGGGTVSWVVGGGVGGIVVRGGGNQHFHRAASNF